MPIDNTEDGLTLASGRIIIKQIGSAIIIEVYQSSTEEATLSYSEIINSLRATGKFTVRGNFK